MNCFRRLGILLICVSSVLQAATFQKPEVLVCSGEKDKSWGQKQQDLIGGSALFHYAVAQVGSPVSCEAKITQAVEEGTFGKFTFHFVDGSLFQTESKPPETSYTSLEMRKEFLNEKEAIDKLKNVTSESGLNIDWKTPRVENENSTQIKTFWDPNDGVNGRGVLTYKDGKLISIGWGAAL